MKTPERALQDKWACADVHSTEFFRRYSPIEEANTSKPEPIMKKKERIYIVDCDACFLCTSWRKVFSSLRRKRTPYDRSKPVWRSKPRMASSGPRKTQGFFYIQELGTHLYDKFVETSHSVLFHGRLCDELESSNSWQPARNPKLTKGKKDHHVLHRQFRSSRRGHSAKKPLPVPGTTAPGEPPVPD